MLAKQETKQVPTPEEGNVFFRDPAVLAKDNPVLLIVNYESLQRMEESFSTRLFLPPHIVRVQTASGISELIVDGMTRVEYAKLHKGEQRNGISFDQIPVLDMTEEYLRQPRVVKKVDPTRTTLTIEEYLRAVVTPTVAHKEIATDRIAAHIINGWRNMVGEEVAGKFSALAALNFLARGAVAEPALKRVLKSQQAFVPGESSEERERLEQSLLETAAIIREAKLVQAEVARSAFALISDQSMIIGGEPSAQKQLWGLLHMSEVEDKLIRAHPDEASKERARVELAELLGKTIQQIREKPGREYVYGILIDALRDPYLPLEKVATILNSPRPDDTYYDSRKESNQQMLRMRYATLFKKEELDPLEEQVLMRLGGKAFINENDVQGIIENARVVGEILAHAERVSTFLKGNRRALIQNGLEEKVIADAILGLDGSIEATLVTDSLQTMVKRAKELQQALPEISSKTVMPMHRQNVRTIVAAEYGYASPEHVPPAIVEYLVKTANASRESDVKAKLQRLQGIDPDLQTQVVSGQIDFNAALDLHNQRRIQAERTSSSRPPVFEELRRTTPVVVQRQPSPAQVRTFQPVHPKWEPDVKTQEQRQKESEDHQLWVKVGELHNFVRKLRVNFGELREDTKEEVDTLLRELGKYRFGHPDIVKVVDTFHSEARRGRNGDKKDSS